MIHKAFVRITVISKQMTGEFTNEKGNAIVKTVANIAERPNSQHSSFKQVEVGKVMGSAL